MYTLVVLVWFITESFAIPYDSPIILVIARAPNRDVQYFQSSSTSEDPGWANRRALDRMRRYSEIKPEREYLEYMDEYGPPNSDVDNLRALDRMRRYSENLAEPIYMDQYGRYRPLRSGIMTAPEDEKIVQLDEEPNDDVTNGLGIDEGVNGLGPAPMLGNLAASPAALLDELTAEAGSDSIPDAVIDPVASMKEVEIMEIPSGPAQDNSDNLVNHEPISNVVGGVTLDNKGPQQYSEKTSKIPNGSDSVMVSNADSGGNEETVSLANPTNKLHIETLIKKKLDKNRRRNKYAEERMRDGRHSNYSSNAKVFSRGKEKNDTGNLRQSKYTNYSLRSRVIQAENPNISMPPKKKTKKRKSTQGTPTKFEDFVFEMQDGSYCIMRIYSKKLDQSIVSPEAEKYPLCSEQSFPNLETSLRRKYNL